jgi:hypothetical protein
MQGQIYCYLLTQAVGNGQDYYAVRTNGVHEPSDKRLQQV